MTLGEVHFKTKGRDDQAEPDEMEWPTKAATLMGVNALELFKAFCKPKIKVGTEWVTKGQSCEQATNGVGGIARAIFDRIFKWLIIKCNDTLIDASLKKANFCAVLDIAGFEIFEYNGFEQISINFVNEKLQQFFNHHMFVVEQEEYVAEGIDWAMVDFGMDLAACIIMFEKPMGIWAILEEESLFPKATDKSFEEKLKASLGKLPCFAKAKSATDKNAHFACVHYAGTVSYNVTGWLEKNKDPVNDTVVDILKKSSNNLLVFLWREHPGQSAPPEEEKKKKKKGGGGKTVSSVYLVQLAALMGTLHSTEPHFIRCIVPNTHKQPGAVEPELIMHQLTCNGVLEGIRICMRGFPTGCCTLTSSLGTKSLVLLRLPMLLITRLEHMLFWTRLSSPERDTVWVTPKFSSGLVLLLVLRRLVMKLYSSWSDGCKVTAMDISKGRYSRRSSIKGSS